MTMSRPTWRDYTEAMEASGRSTFTTIAVALRWLVRRIRGAAVDGWRSTAAVVSVAALVVASASAAAQPTIGPPPADDVPERLAARDGVRAVFGFELGRLVVPNDVAGGEQHTGSTPSPLAGAHVGASLAIGSRFELRGIAVVRYAIGNSLGWDCGDWAEREARDISNCTGTWSAIATGADFVLRARPLAADSAWYLGLGIEAAALIVSAEREWDTGRSSYDTGMHHTAPADQTTALLGVVAELGWAIGAEEAWDLGLRVIGGLGGRGTDESYTSVTLQLGGAL